MKKILILFLAVVMLTLTGCGNGGSKTLTCTMKEDEQIVEGKLTYKNDSLVTVSSSMSYDYSKEEVAEEEIEYLKTIFKLGCSTYENDKAVNCSYDVTTKKASLTIVMDVTKASAETLENLDLSDEDIKSLSYDQAKKSLTDTGYTCK